MLKEEQSHMQSLPHNLRGETNATREDPLVHFQNSRKELYYHLRKAAGHNVR